MCWAVPARVIEIKEDNIVIVDFGNGIIKEVVNTIEDLKPGDYVLVHAGLIIEKLKEEQIEEMLKFYQELVNEIAKDTNKSPEEIDKIFREIDKEIEKMLEMLR